MSIVDRARSVDLGPWGHPLRSLRDRGDLPFGRRRVRTTPPGETVEVELVVNGSPVSLRVPTRLTLADALRNHLGLTGTHLGCEHGVCGMCTVLVDGDAARSCLLFAAQLDGAEVVTVEGLGSAEDQHPLQEAFSHHHALQCGFCTPGFLMSAYDLLSHQPDVTPEDLPRELSGVLCRCTGYRNILAAVADVGRQYPDGLPGPRHCAPHGTVGRSGLASSGLLAGPQGRAAAGEVEARSATPAEPTELQEAHGEPTLVVDVTSDLSATVDQVWAVMDDIDLLAACLPGAELTEHLGDDRYACRARVGLGAVRLSFAGRAQVTERSATQHLLAVRAQGSDAGAGQTQAQIRLVAEAHDDGARVSAQARVWLSGRIAQFGRALAGDVTNRMFEQFAASLQEAATTGSVSAVPTAAPGALRMTLQALRSHLAGGVHRRRNRR